MILLFSTTPVPSLTPLKSIATLLEVEIILFVTATFEGILLELNFSTKTPTPEALVMLFLLMVNPDPSSLSKTPTPDSVVMLLF